MKTTKKLTAGLLALSMVVTGVFPAFSAALTEASDYEYAELHIPDSEDDETVIEVAEVTEEDKETETTEEASILLYATPSGYGNGLSVSYDGENWMHYLNDSTCLRNLTIPQAHDASTFHIQVDDALANKFFKEVRKFLVDKLWMIPPFSLYAAIEKIPLVGKVAKKYFDKVFGLLDPLIKKALEASQKLLGRCQELTYEEMLDAGVRMFDIRYRYNTADGKFYLVHGDMDSEDIPSMAATCWCYDKNGKKLTLDAVFSTFLSFLEEHPDEIIFLEVIYEGGPKDKTSEKALYLLEKKYDIYPYLARRPHTQAVLKEEEGVDSKPDINDDSYTVGSFRGRILDITRQMGDEQKISGSYYMPLKDKPESFKKSLETDYARLMERDCNIQFKFYHFMDKFNECEFPLSVTSRQISIFGKKITIPTGISFDWNAMVKTPEYNARYVNPKICALLNDYYNTHTTGKGLGIICADFMNEKLCWNIVRINAIGGYGPEYIYKDMSIDPLYPGECDIVPVNYNMLDLTALADEFEQELRALEDSVDDNDDTGTLYTGAPNAPVTDGIWNIDDSGIWHYSTILRFRNTWGYIQNPYAKDGQNQSDWFWFDADGNMLTGWQYINGKWYYLNPTKDGTLGACLIGPGVTPDGYEIDEYGAWTGR